VRPAGVCQTRTPGSGFQPPALGLLAAMVVPTLRAVAARVDMSLQQRKQRLVLPWSGRNLSRTADLDAVRRAEPFRRACFSSAPLIRSQPVTAVCSENKDSGSTGHGMVIGMASKKVTVTLDETQLDRIRALVAAGTAASVSGFVQHAVGVALDDVAGWGALLAEALRETGGALSDSERAWADEALGTGGRSAA
jgi:Arc/MetJ-type ribon-helix-helix transcriptional regulator